MPRTILECDKVSGIFRPGEELDQVLLELNNRGYTWDEVSLFMSESTRNRHFAPHEPRGKKTIRSAAAGGVIGAVVGAMMAAPMIGILVAGPVMAILGGSAVGAATGGFIGLLRELGISESNAKIYQSQVEEGNVLVVAHVLDKDAPTIQSLFLAHGAQEIEVSKYQRQPFFP